MKKYIDDMSRDELRRLAKTLDKELKSIEDELALLDKRTSTDKLMIKRLWQKIETIEWKVGLK